ncbi:MAG: LysM peptidoglycan-binding domain-containing protein [Bacilli bacterium]|nr:LysM peptidoglycan-binding domain-containing protein [Bacilli bacterium]
METYTVLPGDTMWRIATKHQIGLAELLTANPEITNAALILPGQTINIPSTNASTYTVMPGDTMWNIAKKHQIGLSDLLEANPKIKNSSLILPGQTINIPKGTSIPNVPSAPSTPSTPNDIRVLETEVIRLVNAERAKAGRSALTENNEVSRVARIKSNDFIENNYFSHNSPTYGTPFEMIESFGITFTAAAENIARGQRTAAEAMNSWMNSSGHRTNILSSTYNQIGVGVARDNDGTLYWTQIFIKS